MSLIWMTNHCSQTTKHILSLSLQLKKERCRLISLKEKEITYLKAKSLKKRVKQKGEAALWKELNIDIKASQCLNIIDDGNGNIITSHKDLIHAIMKKLASKQTKNSKEPIFPRELHYDHRLQPSEIDRAVASLITSKATGSDTISATFLKEFYCLDKSFVQNMLLDWWDSASIPTPLKQTRLTLIAKSSDAIKKLNSFRPIGVGNQTLVIFEKILNDRLYYFVNKNVLVKEQLGFRKGLRLSEALKPFNNFITDSTLAGRRTVIWKADVESAFDMITSAAILNSLTDHIPNNLWLLIKDLLTNREVVYYSSDPHFKFSFKKTVGTTQGSVLSPTLFASVMGILHKKFNSRLKKSIFSNISLIGPFSYADDLFGAFTFPQNTPSNTAVTEANLFLSFIERTFDSILKSWGLNLAKNKLECVMIGTLYSNLNVINIGTNCNFTLLKKVKILGLTFGKINGSIFGFHVQEKCQEIKELLYDYRKNTWHYSFNLRKIIIHRSLLTKLFYLGELWAGHIGTNQLTQLNQIIRLLSIFAIGGASTVSLIAASSLARIPPAFIWIQELILLDSISTNGILHDGNVLRIHKNAIVSDHFHPAFIPQPDLIQTHFVDEESIEVEGSNDIHIYTDASLSALNGGISVVAPKTKKSISLKTHKLTNIFELELKAIHIALLMAEELFLEDKRLLKKIVVLSDSLSSLTNIQNLSSRNMTVLLIRKSILYHSKWGRTIHLIWVKAHNNVYGNELADSLAKEATLSGHPFTIDIPTSVLKAHVSKCQRDAWKHWFQSAIHNTTRFSDFFGANDFPPDLMFTPNFNLTALFTSHSPLYNDYKHRLFKNTNGCCPCDNITPQTGKHAITECPLLIELRNQAYLSLNIEQGIYNHKNLTTIKKDNQFLKFAYFVSKGIKNYWS